MKFSRKYLNPSWFYFKLNGKVTWKFFEVGSVVEFVFFIVPKCNRHRREWICTNQFSRDGTLFSLAIIAPRLDSTALQRKKLCTIIQTMRIIVTNLQKTLAKQLAFEV